MYAMDYEYDFGSGMPLPPQRYQEVKEEHYFDSQRATFHRGVSDPLPFLSWQCL